MLGSDWLLVDSDELLVDELASGVEGGVELFGDVEDEEEDELGLDDDDGVDEEEEDDELLPLMPLNSS